MKDLTKAEEEVMQILWKLEKAFVKEILNEFKDPQPAYNTVSTITRILEKKGFVGHEAFGKSHRYFPSISKEAYKEGLSKSLLNNYFEGSAANMMSFFVKTHDIDTQELDAILKNINSKKHKK